MRDGAPRLFTRPPRVSIFFNTLRSIIRLWDGLASERNRGQISQSPPCAADLSIASNSSLVAPHLYQDQAAVGQHARDTRRRDCGLRCGVTGDKVNRRETSTLIRHGSSLSFSSASSRQTTTSLVFQFSFPRCDTQITVSSGESSLCKINLCHDISSHVSFGKIVT
ncbi:hypothetical protein GQ43DRAFT_257285 [Delitschia confertaspora ATCC 74209]|uniref:Uncharacterized protein n=1 Tax=Delitschia confertaspora ATCC 74209 TaxID=1513339 RepID=A0A9P4JGU3_9PLEO|nr:hypothetical protein GQ43DRAFT_257285 [Delitschia confertaspora ATCC 74209]